MLILPADTTASFLSIAAGPVMALLGWFVVPRRLLYSIKRAARALAGQHAFLLVFFTALSLLLNALIALKNGLPRVRVQDEFSYLLAADTFSHARVTNPTPAFWEHFETPHELMRPTYMSKYPPGQGLALAMGQVLFGMPIVGIWIVTAIACGFVYWTLLGFVRPDWAMLGGAMTVLHPQVLQWSQNYWGGSVAVLGGAMVLGGWVRLMSKTPAKAAPILWLSLGLGILANSRPYEGLVLVIPLGAALAWTARRRAIKLGIVVLILLTPFAAVMGYFNFRVTGHLLRMPFVEYARQYDIYPKFWFLPKKAAPVYHSQSMAEIHTDFERGDYYEFRTLTGFLRICRQRLGLLIFMHTQPYILLLPLLAGISLLRWNRQQRWLWLTAGFFAAGLLVENFFLQHYAAPISPLMLVLIVIGWQRLAAGTCRGRRIGQALAVIVGVGLVIGAGYRALVPVDLASLRVGQQSLIDQAQGLQTGRHLIFVRYGPGHLVHDEWVYNQADLEQARIIWARYEGPAADALVARHFAGREIWLLTVGKDDLTLNMYALPHLPFP